MTDVIMPQMGESIAEGTITRWMKKVGDRVQRDEPLFEISTDKVDAEIPSPASGVLTEIRATPGATVPINSVVGVIAGEGEAVAAPPPPAVRPAAIAAPAPPSPAPPPAPAPSAASAAATPPAGVPPVAYMLEDKTPVAGTPRAAPASAPPPPPSSKPRPEMTVEELRQMRSSPVVRRIAAEHNVDIRQVAGTGISGRVTKQDILGHIEGKGGATARFEAVPVVPPTPPAPAARPAAPSSATPPPPPAPAATPGARVEIVPMTPIRRKTAEHMVASKRTSAHVTTVFEIEMTRVEQLKAKYRQAYEERSGVRLTYTPFILKATVDALKAYPVVNASIEGDSIVYRKDVNIGLAVALDWGLIVPVIHNADEKNILGLARAVNDLADRARAKKLRVDEVQGGTFTITNPGVFGSLFGTPIINQPQVAILGVGTIEKRAVVRDDAIAIRTMSYFALSFDHRLVDGADADRFMAHLKKGLQEFDESAL
jgi:2-oxoglutarate dehydrogenase E2 component (dihydrolipoamide succinyltransferase)